MAGTLPALHRAGGLVVFPGRRPRHPSCGWRSWPRWSLSPAPALRHLLLREGRSSGETHWRAPCGASQRGHHHECVCSRRPQAAGEQVLPRSPLHRHHRWRHEGPDRQGCVLGEPERARRHGRRRRAHRRAERQARLRKDRSGVVDGAINASGRTSDAIGEELRHINTGACRTTRRSCSPVRPSWPAPSSSFWPLALTQ